MTAQLAVFYILSALAILSAMGVVVARSPVHSAVSLVLSFVNVAGIFVIGRAEFLAVAQVIVYTGAILVLVLFVIMLVQQEDLPEFHGGRPVRRVAGLVIGLLLLGQISAAIFTRTITGPQEVWTPDAVAAVGGNVQVLGQILYTDYVLAVQVIALVLLVGTIGALVLARPDIRPSRSGTGQPVSTISLGHSRGSDFDWGDTEVPALPEHTRVKPETGERNLVMTKSGDEYVDRPAWGERRDK